MFKLSSAMRFGSVVAMTASVLPRSCPLQIRITDWCHDSWQLLLGVVAGTCFAAAFFEGDPNRQFIVTELSFVQLHGSVTRAGRRRHG